MNVLNELKKNDFKKELSKREISQEKINNLEEINEENQLRKRNKVINHQLNKKQENARLVKN